MYIKYLHSPSIEWDYKDEVAITDITSTDVLVLDDDSDPFSITKDEMEAWVKLQQKWNESNFNTLLSAWKERGYQHLGSNYGVWVLRDHKMKHVSYAN